MPGEHEVLQHLLDLETEAAALVDDAQAEADRRAAEGEKAARTLYDEEYAKETAVLADRYTGELKALREEYQKQLDSYREGLKDLVLNMNAFTALAEKLLIGET
jgi:hypothetical protein